MFRSVAVALSLGLVGCATAPTPTARMQKPTAISSTRVQTDATGVWDWMFRSQDDQGDERVEQEEWHLAQRGARVEGYYDRKVTMLSVDERLFRCNQKLGFTKVTRVRVAGQVEGTRVQLKEIAFDAKPSPCDDGARNLVEYNGTLRDGAHLALQWGPQAGQTLVRRSPTDGALAPLVQSAELNGNESNGVRQASNDSSNASAEVGGTWEWELRSIDAEGDERLEREEWHLAESADGVKGYYDRTVRRVRGEGVFVCNGEERFETSTRYSVVGQRFGEKVVLREIDYKADKNACDNAQRRLDTYTGHVSDAESLVLSWGPGNQLLRRKH